MAKKEEAPEIEGSVLDYNLEEVPELAPVDDGEYIVEIRGTPRVNAGNTNGNDWKILNCVLTLPEEPAALNVFYSVWLPVDADDIKTRNEKLDKYRKFLNAFGVDTSRPVNLVEMQGLRAYAILGRGKDNRDGSIVNEVRQFIRPA